MENTGYTKALFIEDLKANKKALEDLGYEKIKSFFPNDELMDEFNYVERFIKQIDYDDIFKNTKFE